jgi:hypothetical protein
MDVIMLSRLQFAAATIFHFLFVPLTLGLSLLIAIMETKYVRSGDEEYKRMAKFWGKLFLINLAIGVVTGITLEFQFGTNWSRYSAYVGDIFGSLPGGGSHGGLFPGIHLYRGMGVRLETAIAQGPRRHHWVVAIASNISAFWDSGGQLVHAASGGLCAAQRPGRAGRFHRHHHPEVGNSRIRPHPERRLCAGRVFCDGHQRLALDPQKRAELL